MIYLPELYYFFDHPDQIDFWKSVRVIAGEVGTYCSYYEAELMAAKKGVKDKKRSGQLPHDADEKREFIVDLVSWIENNSEIDLFKLLIHNQPITKEAENRPFIFDHPDDTCCWVLNISEEQFRKLQNALIVNNLPEDLYFPESKSISITLPHGRLTRFLRRLGFTGGRYRFYTPKQWEEEQK